MNIQISSESALLIKNIVSEIVNNSNQSNWYDVIQSLGVGIGTFLLGLGAILSAYWTIPDWVRKKREEYKQEKKKKQYKNKYPVEDIGKTFYLVWFNGKLILFDNKSKKYYHIYPWETAEDLNFVTFGVQVKDNFPNPTNSEITIDEDTKINTNDFKNGGSINTQR